MKTIYRKVIAAIGGKHSPLEIKIHNIRKDIENVIDPKELKKLQDDLFVLYTASAEKYD
jgi:hypothetical protein